MSSLSLSRRRSPSPYLPPTLTRIVLTGFMGAGKSTVGRELAARIGWNFLDLDDLIEAARRPLRPDIFATHGEPQLPPLRVPRPRQRALARPHTVLALGGGAPETLTNRLLIEQTPGTLAIFLDAPFSTLFDRCMLQSLNPSATPRPNRRRRRRPRSPSPPPPPHLSSPRPRHPRDLHPHPPPRPTVPRPPQPEKAREPERNLPR